MTNEMKARNIAIAELEDVFEDLENIRDEKLAPYAMDPSFLEPERARELGLTEEEMKNINEIMLDVDAAFDKLASLLEKMEEADQ